MSTEDQTRKPLAGVFPLVPFAIKEDQSSYFDGLTENIDFRSRLGAHGTFSFCCMGEFYSPTLEE